MHNLIDVKEARALLRISEPTLYRLIRSGRLPVVKVGTRTLLLAQDVEAFIDRSRVVKSAKAEP